ncbi:alpha/beta hydrolase [Gilvimarinus sp. SDUM040013]|uniref:Alpha/beta hydrolase n=1 Tax=Gilvimarinus gilvus TaxID=3058038 RepID=A0ABU4S675_9GAMM|nr:alpha/beta hydrolase [Gilvimarinus sp. SDUM040013]MDO3384813.1 alpha/beta hydrolase [Gilvimarinus sp. SDUM040013]MDX6850854.1 alpha/beta hydrolase [Gilvimarinus sp. SDUM040013]
MYSTLRKLHFVAVMLVISLSLQAKELHKVTKVDDLVWAEPKGYPLKVDIYSPKTNQDLNPVVVIYHGGGWLINNESIMDSMSQYLAERGFVVANINYRLLPTLNNTTTMNEIIEDVFGGLLWVKANIAQYGGDPTRVAITGDSAGGHLTSMILTHGRELESDGYSGDSLGFNPTWLPQGKTAEQVASEDGLKVQAAVVSYGAFDLLGTAQGGFETAQNIFWQFAQAEPRGMFGGEVNVDSNPEHYRMVSPLYNIPAIDEYKLPPQLHHVGSEDTTTTAASIKVYVDKMRNASQPAELIVYEGNNHAYMDSGCLEVFDSCFDTHAVPVLEKDIVPFLHEHL